MPLQNTFAFTLKRIPPLILMQVAFEACFIYLLWTFALYCKVYLGSPKRNTSGEDCIGL